MENSLERLFMESSRERFFPQRIAILKEPLLWFFIVGALLFTADNYFSQDPDTIVVNESVRDRLNKLWQVQTGNPATKLELDSLLEHWIREEVLYREALKLGLDRNDTIVRRRLVQKIGFLVEDVEVEEDQRQSMLAYYEDNITDYSLPARYSFSQIYFQEKSRSSEIQTQLEQGVDWRELSETSMLEDSYTSKNQKEISAALGLSFAGQVHSFFLDRWVGPVKSSFGFHLVRLERILPSESTPIAFIERRVLADYLQYRQETLIEDYYRDLLGKYKIVFD